MRSTFQRNSRTGSQTAPQLFPDGLAAYTETVGVFGKDMDYGQVVKSSAVVNLDKDAASRYSPAQVVKAQRTVIRGAPDTARNSTSHVEKQSHTVSMLCRRLTRLTNGFSKRLEHFQAAVGLNFAYCDFCKRPITVRTTPAMAPGVEDHEWTVAELVERCGE